jgi:serine/threonine protein kinase
MADSHADCDPLDLVAAEFAARCRRGEHPPVSEFLERHPEWADELRAMLPAVALLENAKRQAAATHLAPPASTAPERLGDYRILRELGRGGMGIVYEAVQESLGRRVALKVLPAHARLDARRRLRFGREAAAAARLHHTNIVPVFGVGEHEGLPYYVMQYIPGRGLDQILGDLRGTACRPEVPPASTMPEGCGVSTPWAQPSSEPPRQSPRTGSPWDWFAVATLGMQVAEALHHAHLQGVLHRDVKPGNILVDIHGTAWVTDFGLAKLAGEPELTATGDLLGTLHYMAPEGFQGRSDERSDVYGLGLVLAELCTLEPPHSANPTELVRRAGGHERPGLRRLNPSVPRDLETVILKATAADPGHRYATASAFAEDLQRFLDDRPVLARRASALRRGARWCRRNRLVAGLAIVALASLVLAAAVGWIGYARTRDALAGEAQRRKEAENAKAQAEDAKAQVDANLDMSLQAFEDIFHTIAPQDHAPPLGRKLVRPQVPTPSSRRTAEVENVALLQGVLHFYDRFAELNATNKNLHQDAAKAYRRVYVIQQRLGQPDEAEDALQRAVALYENLVKEYPSNQDYRYELAELCAHSGPGTLVSDATLSGNLRLRRAIELADGLLHEYPHRVKYQLVAAEVHARLGAALSRRGEQTGAESHHREAVRLLEHLPAQTLSDQPRTWLRASRLALAEALLDRGEAGEARPLLESAVRVVCGIVPSGTRPFRLPPELAWLPQECSRLIHLCHRAGAEAAVAELARRVKRITPRSPTDQRRAKDIGSRA